MTILTGHATTLSAGFDLPTEPAGWPEMLVAGARLAEKTLTKVDRTAHAATKLRIREEAIAGVRDDIERLPTGDAAQF